MSENQSEMRRKRMETHCRPRVRSTLAGRECISLADAAYTCAASGRFPL